DNKVLGIVGMGAVLGAMMALVGSVASLPVIVFGFWMAMFVLPLGGAFSQAIWMAKVDPDVQGGSLLCARPSHRLPSPSAFCWLVRLRTGCSYP
ncbi:MAG: hypothetical protein V3S28_08340, partial [Acidimicrobiia bacterium]